MTTPVFPLTGGCDCDHGPSIVCFEGVMFAIRAWRAARPEGPS